MTVDPMLNVRDLERDIFSWIKKQGQRNNEYMKYTKDEGSTETRHKINLPRQKLMYFLQVIYINILQST